MTPNTAGARDWAVEAGRLLSEECRRHDTPFPQKHECHECLASALAAAYEAGRADQRDATHDCQCADNPEPFRCGCCGAKSGEPCRHKRSEP